MARRRRKLADRASRHDHVFHRAREQGYAARAALKLSELDERFRLLRPGRKVLDLGCWPGSWLQVAAERVGSEGLCVGLDLRAVEIPLPAHAHTAVADVTELDPAVLVRRFGPFDLVLSDMAPHTSGDRASDQFRSEELVREAVRIASGALRPGGHLVVKIFQGPGFPDILRDLQARYQEVRPVKARTTRAGSREQYLVARGLRAARPTTG